MNKKITKLAGAVVFLILINIGLFSLAAIKLTSFWISWIFIHIAFLIFAGILIFSAPEQRKLKFAYSETAVAAYYFIIELIAGYVLLTYFVFIPVISFVIQTVILAVFLFIFRYIWYLLCRHAGTVTYTFSAPAQDNYEC